MIRKIDWGFDLQAKMIDILNFMSPLLGIFGSWMIYKFGIPSRIDTKGESPLILEEEDENEKREIQKYKKRGSIGIWLIIFSFILQLCASEILNSMIHATLYHL